MPDSAEIVAWIPVLRSSFAIHNASCERPSSCLDALCRAALRAHCAAQLCIQAGADGTLSLPGAVVTHAESLTILASTLKLSRPGSGSVAAHTTISAHARETARLQPVGMLLQRVAPAVDSPVLHRQEVRLHTLAALQLLAVTCIRDMPACYCTVQRIPSSCGIASLRMC